MRRNWRVYVGKVLKPLLLIIITIVLFSINANSQNQTANLEKYWKYRARLVDDFMVQSPDVFEMGVNVPMAAFWAAGGQFSNLVKTGDGNNVRGNYLGVLATELWLLKNNEQDYSETLKELFYFMLAMERLDAYSESYIRAGLEYDMFYDWDYTKWDVNSHYQEGDINGFQIRNDADENFWDTYKSEFPPNYANMQSTMYNIPANRPLNPNSQDNIIHILLGLSLLESLVENEDISNIPITYTFQHIPNYLSNIGVFNYNYVDFGLWAQDLTKRYLDYIQNESIKQFDYATWVYLALGLAVPGFASKWYLWDEERDHYVFQGAGTDGDLHSIFSHGLLDIGKEITGINLQEPLNWLPLTRWFYELEFSNPFLPHATVNKLTRFVGALGDAKDSNTLEKLRNHLTTEFEKGSDSVDRAVPLEHLPLTYMILFREKYDRDDFYIVGSEDYNDEIDYYNNMLNCAEECGTCSYLDSLWSTSSRLNWPENITTRDHIDQKYSGLDYMLLHNLRYIAYHWPEYDDVIADPSYSYESVVLTGGDIYSESSIYNADIEFKATRKIILQPGFKVENAHFLAHIGADNDGYIATNYNKLSVSKCDLPDISQKKSAKHNNDSEKVILSEDADVFISQINIYPNPINDFLSIRLPLEKDSKSIKVKIYNAQGELAFEKAFENSKNLSINADNLKRGLHIVVIDYAGEITSKKIIKL